MEAKVSRAPSGASGSGEAHAGGDALLAVAEGNSEAQPAEATLTHIFSCEQCSANVREIRQGLAGLGLVGNRKGAAATPAKPQPARLDLAMPGLPLSASGMASEYDGAANPVSGDDAQDASDRSRKLIWKVAIVGVVLAIALFYVRSLASNMH